MSITNSILKLLNMEDENLSFDDDWIEYRKIKGINSTVIKGYLSNSFDSCPKCDCVNSNTIIKKGCVKSLIKINKISDRTSYLELRKQRYLCKGCNSKFTAKTSIVDYRCHIAKNVKIAIINLAKEIMSKSLIARIYNVSDNTVQNIFDTAISTEKLYKSYLPSAICIDEFMYKKGVFAFNICDASNGKTVDIVEDRTTSSLEKYFSYYKVECRKMVKFVVCDMYSPYIDLITKFFPNAKIIIDLFHIVQLLSNSMNKTRIEIMKSDKEDKNKFKKYWKLILKSRFDLCSNKWKKFRCFKNLMTEIDVVDYLINKDKTLKNTYELYQDILYYLQHRDYENFHKIINTNREDISERMKTTIKTLKKYSKYIENTLNYSYSNGVMERNNNTCKLLKRISFGFRNFRNMKSRIMIVTRLFRKKKREYHTKYSTPKFA